MTNPEVKYSFAKDVSCYGVEMFSPEYTVAPPVCSTDEQAIAQCLQIARAEGGRWRVTKISSKGDEIIFFTELNEKPPRSAEVIRQLIKATSESQRIHRMRGRRHHQTHFYIELANLNKELSAAEKLEREKAAKVTAELGAEATQ